MSRTIHPVRPIIPCLLAVVGCSEPSPSPSPLLGAWFDKKVRFRIEFRGDGTFVDSSHDKDGSLYADHHGVWQFDGHHLVLTDFNGPPAAPASSKEKHRYVIEWLDNDTFGFHDEDALYLRCRRQ